MFEISKRVRLFSFVIHFPSPLSPFTEAHDGSSPPLRGGDGGIKPSFFSLSMCFGNLCWNQYGSGQGVGVGDKPHAAEQSGIKEALRTQPVVLWCLAFPEHPSGLVLCALSVGREDLQPRPPPSLASKEAVCKPPVNYPWGGITGRSSFRLLLQPRVLAVSGSAVPAAEVWGQVGWG